MSTERVPWSRLDSGEFEHTVAMLVCADHPLGQKFTPGPDGGIDVFVPDGDSQRKVFQVKNFPLKFANAEFRQVRKSLRAVAETSRQEGWAITEWHLVIPRDSSPGYRARIEEEVKSLGIPTWSWMGLTRLDIFAARHPERIDYYLKGGKDRLADQLADLTAIIRGDTTLGSGTRLQPADVGDRIRILQRAANNDPHYRYHFGTSDCPPHQVDEPWLVAVAAEQHGPMWLHIKVYAKFAAALSERPITTTVQVDVTGDPALAESFEQFLDFGTDLTIPSSAASAELNLPGGLGGTIDSAEIHFTAITAEAGGPEPASSITVGVRDATGDVVAELRLERKSFTSGVRGGQRTVWADRTDKVELALRTRFEPIEVEADFRMNWDAYSQLPGDLIDAVSFMDAVDRGVSIGLSPSHGPRRYSWTVPYPHDRNSNLHLTARLVRALNVIQQHSTDLLRIPSALSAGELRHVFEAATLLQGQAASTTWSPFEFTIDATDRPTLTAGSRINVAVTQRLNIELDGEEHHLGQVAAFLDAVVDSVDGDTVALSPGDPDARATRVLAEGEEYRVWVAATDAESKRPAPDGNRDGPT